VGNQPTPTPEAAEPQPKGTTDPGALAVALLMLMEDEP
jgi:hypothetical protein